MAGGEAPHKRPAQKGKSSHPRKRFYRARAHSNPLSDSHFPVPISPAHIDWSEHFPAFFTAKPAPEERPSAEIQAPNDDDAAPLAPASPKISENQPAPASLDQRITCEAERFAEIRVSDNSKIRFADIGCGFGGLLVKLSHLFPSTLMIGMELRDKVSEYVKERILALRKENPGKYQNVSIIRTNAMKYLHNFFQKGQLHKMFFLFPDPHFKERNHRRRVISVALLAEYAHVMAVGGILYTITDVPALGEWMKSCLDLHPLFEEVPIEEQKLDPVVELLKTATEEGQKVQRNGGETFQAVYRRVPLQDVVA